MTEIELVENDRNFPLIFKILYADGVPVDLTDAVEIKLKFTEHADGLVYELVGYPDIGHEKEGLCWFQVTDQFVGLSGEYRGKIEITWASGKVLSAPNILIRVHKDLSG